jgi:hypothetical protein
MESGALAFVDRTAGREELRDAKNCGTGGTAGREELRDAKTRRARRARKLQPSWGRRTEEELKKDEEEQLNGAAEIVTLR